MKKMSFFCFSLMACLLVEACSNSVGVARSETLEVTLAEDSLSGMVHVHSSGFVVALGTENAFAKANERPRMKVILDYDFSIGKHEVSCGEFNALMAPLSGLLLDCENDEIPATNLTYYDAVLFANEQSKAQGFDTAYTYVRATFDAEKHCSNLEGFSFHPGTQAYRLPTEAEWVLVANSQWNEGWTAENSNFKLHKVCSFENRSTNVCDMVGNAMEWVNDWLGSFRDTTITNYVGAPDGGSLGQRVVKGGSFRHQKSSITAYSRGDVYMVNSSTRADYVGFRLAFGEIPDAVWMGADGNAATSRIVPLVTSAYFRSLTGTNRVKLVFRNDLTKNLAFIDYSNGLLSITEIGDSLDVYHPEISPDGKKVAFCTGLEGVSGKSSLYVRDLNAEGTNLVKLDVESAAIPRWMVLPNGDTAIVYVTDAGDNKSESEFKSASTWQVTFANGKFGTPQKLFDGAYHGGISEDNTLAVTGARLLRARIAKPNSTVQQDALDTVWYKNDNKGEQACNVSLARDSSKRTLFLDFGGMTGRTFVGKDYRTHERLFVADASGELKQSVASPSGWTFDHSEWTLGGKNLVVATLTNANGAHTKIVLVNLTDSSVVDLAEGDELWHPCLWVKYNDFLNSVTRLDVDSAGVYFNESGGEAAIILRYKMELLWKYRNMANVVIVGSSRSLDGVVPTLMSPEFFALNLSNVPNIMAVSDYLLSNYVFPHVEKLKFIIVSLDIDLWYRSEFDDGNFFYREYRNYPGYVYDEKHNFWKEGISDDLSRLTEESLGMEHYAMKFMESRGYNYEPSNTWELNPAVEYDSTWMRSLSSNYYASLSHLKNILQSAENNGVYVIGVVFPQSPNFKKTGSWGRYGIRRSEAPALLAELKSLSSEYPHFVFFEQNNMGNHDYSDEMASNKDHLCYLGAVQMTSRLDSIMKSLE